MRELGICAALFCWLIVLGTLLSRGDVQLALVLAVFLAPSAYVMSVVVRFIGKAIRGRAKGGAR